MRDVELINKGEFYWVEDSGYTVTGSYTEPMQAIREWEYFEKLNTNREPHRRFLNHITPLEEVEEIVNKLKDDI